MIIGLVGFIGAGKGTVADILVREHDFEKLAFADTVKDAVSSIFGWRRDLLEGDTKQSREFRECPDPFWSKKFGVEFTPRKAMQLMGTEAGRNVFHNDIWIYSLEKKIELLINIPVVISDVRFPNEIDAIRKRNGMVIQVKRGEDPVWYDELIRYYNEDENWFGASPNKMMHEKYPDIHYSEWAWVGAPMDYIIYNDGSLDELEANINYLLTKSKGPCKISA